MSVDGALAKECVEGRRSVDRIARLAEFVAILATTALATWSIIAARYAPAALAFAAICAMSVAAMRRTGSVVVVQPVADILAPSVVEPEPPLESDCRPEFDALPHSDELLEYVQDVLEAHGAGDTHVLLRKVARLPILLQRNGIEVLTFDGSNDRHFEFFKSVDPETHEFRTLRPALLVNGQLGRPGVVARPYGGE